MRDRRLVPPLLAALLSLPQLAPAQQADPDHACIRDIHKHVSFRDPDSIKVVGISEGKFEVIDYADKRIAAVKFTVMVNSTGERGGYTRAKPYQCWTSEDRQRVLDYKPRSD